MVEECVQFAIKIRSIDRVSSDWAAPPNPLTENTKDWENPAYAKRARELKPNTGH